MSWNAPERTTRRRRNIGAGALASAAIATSLVGIPVTAEPSSSTITLYDDALGAGFANWSWTPTDMSAPEPDGSGTAISVDYSPWSGMSLVDSRIVPVPDRAVLTFRVHGGDNDAVELNVVARDASFGPAGGGVRITASPGEWTLFTIPVAALGNPRQLTGVWWQEVGGADLSPVLIDDISITVDPTTSVSTVPPTTVPPTTVPPATVPTSTVPTTTEPTSTVPTTTVPTPVTTTTEPEPGAEPSGEWAFEETFDGDPAAPSQALLPTEFEYAVTHRSHAKEHFTKQFGPFPVDHAENCMGPNPEVVPLPQRQIFSAQDTTGSQPDQSFFVCKNHMMSAMGNVAGYSLASFWPRQEFDFADGGTLEFDVNVNDGHGNRSWWEVMIVPRDQMKVAPGPLDSPISETYSNDRIVLDFRRNVRTIKVGAGALAPDGWSANETQWNVYDFAWWRDMQPNEPGLDDRRIRRTMQVRLDGDHIVWGIETPDGSFDEWRVEVPGGLPFDRGLVMFKTHAYNPTKDGNVDTYTFHWDDIRFDGPVLEPYEVYEADSTVYLQRDGHRPIGDQQSVTIDVPDDVTNPVLFGQLHQPMRGQVLLSINGGPDIAVTPYEYDRDDCISSDWKSFRLPLDDAQLEPGENTLTWTVGPRPDGCALGPYEWDGFSAKFLQIQSDPTS